MDRAAVANIKLLNPDFEYMFFDDRQVEEFIDKEFPEYRSVFHSFPVPIQRYDFFRYLAIYRFGGFYLDMDVFLASSLSELLDFGCVFPFESLTINAFLREECEMDWEIGNYAFGAAAGHPFLLAIIENCIRAQKDRDWSKNMGRSVPRIFREAYHVLYTTGPLLVSRTLAEFPDAAKQVKVLFPEDVCDSTYWNRFGHFGVHLMGGGWRKKNGLFRRRLQGYWELFMLKKMAKVSREIGKRRSLKFKSNV
jgi:inositol phosphorylceramide mannosyltransferase catalytic subunit